MCGTAESMTNSVLTMFKVLLEENYLTEIYETIQTIILST